MSVYNGARQSDFEKPKKSKIGLRRQNMKFFYKNICTVDWNTPAYIFNN